MATLIHLMQNDLSQKSILLPNETKRIVLKNYLQIYALDFLYNHPLYHKLNFYGGTCLHLVYDLNRLSEDIDLDNSNQVDLVSLENDLLTFFHSEFGDTKVSAKTQTGEWNVRRITLKFSILYELGLTQFTNEPLHLKIEISPHKQVSVIRKTPVLLIGKSFVVAHFSLETMMAGKMIACLERNFQKGKGAMIKGRDFYDLLWFMQQRVQPLEEKLAKDGNQSYTIQSAMKMLKEKVETIRLSDLAEDLLPLFEQRSFIEAWLEGFKEIFFEYLKNYQ